MSEPVPEEPPKNTILSTEVDSVNAEINLVEYSIGTVIVFTLVQFANVFEGRRRKFSVKYTSISEEQLSKELLSKKVGLELTYIFFNFESFLIVFVVILRIPSPK